jgi:DNA invertase Pin-like site-specific DNA recombinase
MPSYTSNFTHSPQYDLKRGYIQLKGYIEERAIELANYIIDKKTTVRAAAKRFGISKSTVQTVLIIGVGYMSV